jgi:tetratricopeptide (TPR) repeat protein
VYDLDPRLDHPSLVSRLDAVARFERLRELAPCDIRIADYIIQNKYTNRPTYVQAMNLLETPLPYSVNALETVAKTAYDQPGRYEKLMLQAAALNPAFYYNLGDHAIQQGQEDQGAEYIDKACDQDPDSVRAANRSVWRVHYYLKKGQTEKAGEIAKFAGEVYSFQGLTAEASFMEATSNYDGAFEWFAKIDERYDDVSPLLDFCLRYKALTGDTRFDGEAQKRVKKLFPKGLEKVSVSSFHGQPVDGVSISGDSEPLRSAGLKQGDVIVALNGIRARAWRQYTYIRDSKQTPEMVLIVWQGDCYHEIRASPPNHLFGVSMIDYKPN